MNPSLHSVTCGRSSVLVTGCFRIHSISSRAMDRCVVNGPVQLVYSMVVRRESALQLLLFQFTSLCMIRCSRSRRRRSCRRRKDIFEAVIERLNVKILIRFGLEKHPDMEGNINESTKLTLKLIVMNVLEIVECVSEKRR